MNPFLIEKDWKYKWMTYIKPKSRREEFMKCGDGVLYEYLL